MIRGLLPNVDDWLNSTAREVQRKWKFVVMLLNEIQAMALRYTDPRNC